MWPHLYKLTIGVLALLTGCLPDSQMYEATNTSSAHSRKDKAFLRSYRISPSTPYLPIKEVFVEQRFMAGSYPARQRWLDSTVVAANLVVVLNKPQELGNLGFDWNLLLADGVGWEDRRELTSCDEPGPTLLRFQLKDRVTFDSPTFSMRLLFMRDSATNVVRTINLTARPL